MKKTLSILTFITLLTQQVFAATNPLLDPTKKSSTIVDIGYNHEKIPVATTIPKTLIDIPALSREIDKNILMKDRVVDTKDCLTDDNGFETCPTDTETCQGNLIPNPGTATPHSNTKYAAKIVTTTNPIVNNTFNQRLVKGCSYTWVSDGTGGDGGSEGGSMQVNYNGCTTYLKTGPLINTESFKETELGYISSTNFTNSDRLTSGHRIMYLSDGDGNAWQVNGAENLSINNGNLVNSSNYSESILGYVSKTSFTNSTQLVVGCDIIYVYYESDTPPHETYVNCRSYSKTGSLTSNYNYIEKRLGYISTVNQNEVTCPPNTGTLINGQCRKEECPYGFVDNTGVGNCKLDYTYYTYSCPSTAGENNTNTTWADANPGGAWYGPVNAGGDCGAVGLVHGGVCGGATAATPAIDNCFRTSYTCPSDPTKDCTKISNNGAIGKNIFSGYQYAAGDATQHNKTLTKNFTCKNNGVYDATKEACVINKQYICLKAGYTYNATVGECIADAVCNDYWNPITNKCESIPVVDCASGFQYNTISMTCEKKLDCSTGSLNSTTNLCEATPNCGTEPGWRYDETTLLCTKDLDTVNLLYQPVKPALQRQFTMDEFQHDTLKFDVTWGSQDLDMHAIGRNSSGGEIYHIWYRNMSVNGGSLNHDYTSGGTEEIRIPVATWKAAGIKTVDMYMHAYDGCNTLSCFGATASYTDRDGVKRTFPLVGNAASLTLITFDLETFKIVYKAPEVVVPIEIINYCDPVPQYQLVNDSLCYFDYNRYSICPTGYTYSTTYNICYRSTGQEILEAGVYQKNATCSTNGYFNSEKRICEFNPTCFNGTINNANHVCSINETNTCFSPATPVNGLDFIGGIWTPRISGYDTLCANSNICSGGGTQITVNGTAMCKSTKTIDCPEGYVIDPAGTGKCLSAPQCPEGYVDNGSNCKLTYNWSTYTCPSGWQGPVEPGADCNGSCNADGCWCNMENAPANNCKKLATISTSGTYTTMEKRDMERHIIKGTSFSPEDLGEFRNMSCGSDCAYYINKISGNGNNICFEKKNGEKKCLPVDNCYFTGEIVPSSQAPNDFIKTLSLMDPHTLRSNYYMLMGDLGAPRTCTIGTYNTTTNKCEPENVNNYSQWTEQGNDSNWVSTTDNTGQAAMNQTVNTNDNAFYLHPLVTQDVTIEGDIGVRSCVDDDTIGLVWGYRDPNNWFGFMWSRANYGGGTDIGGGSNVGMRLIEYRNGNVIELAKTDDTYGWNCGGSVPVYARIKAEITETTMKIYRNGVLSLEYTSPTTLPMGKNGYFGISEADAWYKNFSIKGEPKCAVGTFFDTRDNHCHAYSCDPGYTLDYNTNTCAQSITSTCRMNGHVGWTGRQNGISSLGAGGMKTSVAVLQATGNATYNANNTWQGFNIATMAVKLTDGFWYVVEKVKDPAGNELPRGTIPSSVKLLDKAYYQIMDTNPNALTCKFNGVQVNGYCGNSIKMTLPGTKMGIVAFSDIESIIGLDSVTADNTFNLNVSIGTNPFTYSGSRLMPIKNLEGLPNLVLEPEYDTYLSNKLDFWDSFVDKDIGFLEFIREVKSEDRADNFVPENVVPYDMLSKGFTVNEYIPAISGVLFVKPTPTTPAECSSFATQIGGSVVTISSFTPDLVPLAYTRGVAETGACSVITNKIPEAFEFVKIAIRKNFYTGGFEYKCSPYTCSNHECATATCVTETIGGTNMQNGVVTSSQTVTYQGTILPDSLKPTDPTVCTDQVCDAKLNYVRQCGREVGCDQRANVTFDPVNNKCLESYCDNGGILNTSTNTCQLFKCPYGTIENAAGACVRP